MYQMMARNFEDKMALLNTILLMYVMNTENVQQDSGEVYLPDDSRNFEDKMPQNVLPNTIYSRDKIDVLHL